MLGEHLLVVNVQHVRDYAKLYAGFFLNKYVEIFTFLCVHDIENAAGIESRLWHCK